MTCGRLWSHGVLLHLFGEKLQPLESSTGCGRNGLLQLCFFSLLQYLVCKRKLESKKEALLILSKELDTCQQERDQYKLMANQLRERHQSLKKKYRELIVGCSLWILSDWGTRVNLKKTGKKSIMTAVKMFRYLFTVVLQLYSPDHIITHLLCIDEVVPVI